MISAASLLQGSNPYESSIQQILQLDAMKRNRLQAEVKTLESQKKALDEIGTAFSSLQTVLDQFSDNSFSTFNTLKGTSSSDAINVLSTDGMSAPGSFDVFVEQVAKRDTFHSAAVENSGTELSAQGSGSFEISVGDSAPVSISLDTTGMTNEEVIQAIKDSINDQSEGQFSASQIQITDTASALSIKSSETGSANEITIGNVQGDFQNLDLNRLFDITELDAKFSVDGVSMTRSSNTIENAVEGLTFEILNTTGSSEQLTISRDTESVKESVQSFVDAFNKLNSEIRNKTHLNSETDSRGVLQRERSIRNLSSVMRQSVILPVQSLAGSDVQILSDLGIEMKQDGTLHINDSDKLESVLALQPELAEQFFNAPDGIVQNLRSGIESSLSGSNNLLDTIDSGFDSKIDRTNNRIERETRFLERKEAQLRKEFTQLNQIIERGQSQFNQIQNFQSNFWV
ncbi:MAG: flagellar filament capping protein FliD [Balneolaceae bacterium]